MLPYLVGGSTSPVDRARSQRGYAGLGSRCRRRTAGDWIWPPRDNDAASRYLSPVRNCPGVPGPCAIPRVAWPTTSSMAMPSCGRRRDPGYPERKMFRVASPHEPPIVFFKDYGAPRAVEEALLDHRRPRPLAPEHEQGPSLISRCGHHASELHASPSTLPAAAEVVRDRGGADGDGS